MQKFFQALKKSDRVLIVIAFLLSALGAVALYSVNLAIDEESLSLVVRQFGFLFVGVSLASILMVIDYRLWQPFYPWLFLGSLLLLGLIFTPLGEVIRGTRSWIDFGFFVWQPIELIKFMMILCLAGYFSKEGRHLRTWKPLVVSAVAVGILTVMTLLQPDLGSAMILFFLWLGLVFVLGVSKWQIGTMLILFTLTGLFGWSFVLRDYQKDRLLTFVDPSRDPLGTGYNLTQSIIAAGSGGLFGRGIGFGSQSQLKFLPESQSDFVFAVIAEELGFAGVVLLLSLLGLLAWRMIKIAKEVRNDFGQIVVVAVTITILVQAIVNIGMNMGLLPVTGLSLPFISAGGSYLLSVWMMIGLVQSVKIHS